MHDLQVRQAAKGSLIAFQANKFCPATSHLPEDYERTIAGAGRACATSCPCRSSRTTVGRVWTSSCFTACLPRSCARRGTSSCFPRSWDDFEQHQDAAVVGRGRCGAEGEGTSATLLKSAACPSTWRESTCRTTLPRRTTIYTHLEFLQRGNGGDRVGTVTQLEVLLDEAVDPLAKCREIDAAFQGGPVETDTRPKGVFQAKSLGDLAQLISMAHVLAYACVGLVLALVATTTVMSVQDRIQEHAVLQTIGVSGPRVFGLVMAESVLLSVAGGIVRRGGGHADA